jgi:hypothetical protein
MSERLSDSVYQIRRKLWTFKLFIAGCSVYDSVGRFCLLVDQKGSGLKCNLRIFSDEKKQQEVMSITTKQLFDFAAAYEVVDTATGKNIGGFKRKGFKSILRDEWIVTDADDNEIGVIQEDSLLLALMRRFLTNLIPQKYEIVIDGATVCTLRHHPNPFSSKLTVDHTPDEYSKSLDRRMALAAGILLCTVEGKQKMFAT